MLESGRKAVGASPAAALPVHLLGRLMRVLQMLLILALYITNHTREESGSQVTAGRLPAPVGRPPEWEMKVTVWLFLMQTAPALRLRARPPAYK